MFQLLLESAQLSLNKLQGTLRAEPRMFLAMAARPWRFPEQEAAHFYSGFKENFVVRCAMVLRTPGNLHLCIYIYMHVLCLYTFLT